MSQLEKLLDRPIVGKAFELAWDHTPLPVPHRRVVRRYSDGRIMELDLADRTQRVMFCGTYEATETAAMRTLLRAGSTFIDAGAHVGWFTTVAARHVGPRGCVHAIEAFPENAQVLMRNIARNGMQNVHVHQRAIADRAGSVTVGRQAGSDSGSATAGPGASEAPVEVPASTLDDVPTGRGPVDLLKIDIEGSEARVLAAAPRTLERVGAVMVEINDGALTRNESSEQQLLGALSDAGLNEVIAFRRPLNALRSWLAPSYRNILVTRR